MQSKLTDFRTDSPVRGGSSSSVRVLDSDMHETSLRYANGTEDTARAFFITRKRERV